MTPKSERLTIFFQKLRQAEEVSSHNEAFKLIATTLNEVEDTLSGVTPDPSRWQSDGRMYPPQADMARPSLEWESVTVYRSVAHRTLIDSNGAFAIQALAGTILFEKTAKNGAIGGWHENESG